MIRLPFRGLVFASILPVALAACGGGDPQRNLDSLDAELTDGNGSGNARDPAMMAALQDQIMVDPALAAQSNTDAVRPPAQPYSGALPADGIAVADKSAPATTAAATSEKLKSTPAAKGDCPNCTAARESLTLGALAARQKSPDTASCAAALGYSTRWAARLPGDLPLYPDARVIEAAGNNNGSCRVRAVSFASSSPLQKVLDFYYTRASNAGYSAEHQADGAEHVLGGTRARDDAAFAIFFTPRPDGGTNVDFLANRGS